MNEILNIISIVIVSIGGTGVVILGLSNWIGKIWINKFAEKHKSRYEKELEKYKNELNLHLNKLNKIEEKALYASNLNYENEFKIYMDIWPKLIDCVYKTDSLYPRGIENVPTDDIEREKYEKEKYEKYCKSFNDYSMTIEKYSPFYREEFYDKFKKIKEKCYFIGNQFYMFNFEVKYSESFRNCRNLKINSKERKKIKENQDTIDSIKEELLKNIREYLNSLVISENIVNKKY